MHRRFHTSINLIKTCPNYHCQRHHFGLSAMNMVSRAESGFIFSSGELIVYPFSGVRRRRCRRCRPPFSKIISSETAWPIKAKFYVKPPWEGGTKVYINRPVHMTKMAAMPIYGKNLKKIFSFRTRSPMILKLGM